MSAFYQPTLWVVPSGTTSTDPNVFPLLRGQKFLPLKGPSWTTSTKTAASRRQVRKSLQSYPVYKFKVRYDVLFKTPSQDDVSTLYAFFNARNGEWGEFFYNDLTESAVSGVQIGVGDGVTQTFQLQRLVAPGTPYQTMEPVYGLNGQPTVYVAGTSTTAFTVNAYGSITFNTAPAEGAAITWSGAWLFLCHFTQDDLTPEQRYSQLWGLDGLEFETLL